MFENYMLDCILYRICFTLWYFKLLQFVMKIIICGLPLENPIKLLKYAITIVDFKQNYVREKKLPTIVVGSPQNTLQFMFCTASSLLQQ